jgi:NADH-quinone oxidoreductase subunit H
VAVATVRAITLHGGLDRKYLLIAIGVVAVVMLGLFFIGGAEEERLAAEEEEPEEAPFDAFAGGYPVPPMPTAPSTARSTAQPTPQPAARQEQ